MKNINEILIFLTVKTKQKNKKTNRLSDNVKRRSSPQVLSADNNSYWSSGKIGYNKELNHPIFTSIRTEQVSLITVRNNC